MNKIQEYENSSKNDIQKFEDLPSWFRFMESPWFSYDIACELGLEFALIAELFNVEFGFNKWVAFDKIVNHFSFWNCCKIKKILIEIKKTGFIIERSGEYKATDNLETLLDQGVNKYYGYIED